MAARFRTAPSQLLGPHHIVDEPQPPDKFLTPGVQHRSFTDEEIKQAFDTFDLDRNRFVGASEIQHILQIIGEEVTDEEIDEMIRICDTDGDGQVTFDEFYKMMTEPEPAKPPPVQRTRKKKSQTKSYLKSKTHQELEAVLKDTPPEAIARGGGRPVAGVDLEAQEQAHKFRAVSVETLVRKLSGGMGKIKPSQIKKAYKRFQEIDHDGSGAIDYSEFVRALEMEDNTVTKQMFRVFDMDGSGSIELKEFIVVLSRYTSAARAEKMKFAFMMFDEDGSGFIERQELVQMLGASFMVEGFTREELEERADKVFDFLNLDRDGAVSYEDFMRLARSTNNLIYALDEEKRTLGQDNSIHHFLSEAEAGDETASRE